MKTINKIKLTAISLTILFMFSCTGNFEEINTNPNNPPNAPAENVMAYVIQGLSSRFGTTEMEYPAAFVGHVTKGSYTDVTNYRGSVPTSIWSGTYVYTLTNANFVIETAREQENQILEAVMIVMKSYAMQMVVDAYGKAPYFDAGKLTDGVIHPIYDDEKEIYEDLMFQLEDANEIFSGGAANGFVPNGDLLYAGDIGKWRKFCNSLHLRMAIRISNIDPSAAETTISKILSDPDTYPIFASNDDNAFIAYPGEGEWFEPWTARHNSIGDDKIAKPIADILIDYNDPRLPIYADSISTGEYIGLEVGLKYLSKNANSNVGVFFVGNPAGSVYFMKYAEIEFIKAEAAARGFVMADAQAAYEAGITASCEEYGIDPALIDAYLLEPQVVWNDDLDRIYMQKWIALFRQSWEAWAEMRRTDIPALPSASDSNLTGHNRTPFRFPYPTSEQNLNSENIPGDVTEVDNYWGYQVWWDTRTGVN